ncbi:MAG: ATP-binding protein [Planctomycetota bacterium]
MTSRHQRPRRIVLTGGPAAGKTAITEVLRRELSDEVTVVPESATILFGGGFPRPSEPRGRRHVQRAIFAVQHELEDLCSDMHPKKTQICDRGSLDGAAYWPGGPQKFVQAMSTTLEKELARYDAVVFLETSAYDEPQYVADGSLRIEDAAEARRLDRRLRKIWSHHPSFHLVAHSQRFYEKVASVLIMLHRTLGIGVSSPELSLQNRRPGR